MKTIAIVLLMAVCCLGSKMVGYIKGPGCGMSTPITVIDKMPEDPEEIKKLKCVIVEKDIIGFNKFKNSIANAGT